MKVLFTMTLPERLSGAENILWTFLRHVDRARIDPVCACVEGPFADELEAMGVRTLRLPRGRLRQLPKTARSIARLRGMLRAERPDLIVNWLTKAQLYGGPAALLARMGDRNAWWQLDFPDGRPGDRLATLLPSAFVGACSDAVAREQGELWPHRRSFGVLPGIDDPRRVSPEELAHLRESLGIAPGAHVVGILGRLIPWKGQHHFIEAVAGIRASGSDVHGVVVGGDAHSLAPAYPAEVARLARTLGVSDSITFTGHVPDPGRYVQLMDVCVSASAREPFGLVVVEAMALGVPVVAVDAGGPAEAIESGRSGVLVPSGSATDLRTGIEPLLADDARRAAIGAGGRERYLERFTAERMTRAMVARLEEAINEDADT